jgi:hypothetical protein
MDLEWYLFEHSYLLGLNVDPITCSLTIHIDAKITYEHPKAKKKNIEESIEESFENISIVFKGVQYLRMINSINLLTNPNDDLGSIEKLELISKELISSRLKSFEKKQ